MSCSSINNNYRYFDIETYYNYCFYIFLCRWGSLKQISNVSRFGAPTDMNKHQQYQKNQIWK